MGIQIAFGAEVGAQLHLDKLQLQQKLEQFHFCEIARPTSLLTYEKRRWDCWKRLLGLLKIGGSGVKLSS